MLTKLSKRNRSLEFFFTGPGFKSPAGKGRFFLDSDISIKMGRLVTRQTILVLFIFCSHLNLGACAGFALANCDWLERTIAFYQEFFQQGRVALGK